MQLIQMILKPTRLPYISTSFIHFISSIYCLFASSIHCTSIPTFIYPSIHSSIHPFYLQVSSCPFICLGFTYVSDPSYGTSNVLFYWICRQRPVLTLWFGSGIIYSFHFSYQKICRPCGKQMQST